MAIHFLGGYNTSAGASVGEPSHSASSEELAGTEQRLIQLDKSLNCIRLSNVHVIQIYNRLNDGVRVEKRLEKKEVLVWRTVWS